MRSIADRYCSLHDVPPATFDRHVLRRALTLPAQVAYPILCLVPGFFAADLEFIRATGRATNLREFGIDAADFKLHPDNLRPLRRWLRLRVSSRKLRRHLATVLETTSLHVATART